MFTIEITYEDRTEMIYEIIEYWVNQGCLWAVVGKTENRTIIVLDKVMKIDVEYNEK